MLHTELESKQLVIEENPLASRVSDLWSFMDKDYPAFIIKYCEYNNFHSLLDELEKLKKNPQDDALLEDFFHALSIPRQDPENLLCGNFLFYAIVKTDIQLVKLLLDAHEFSPHQITDTYSLPEIFWHYAVIFKKQKDGSRTTIINVLEIFGNNLDWFNSYIEQHNSQQYNSAAPSPLPLLIEPYDFLIPLDLSNHNDEKQFHSEKEPKIQIIPLIRMLNALGVAGVLYLRDYLIQSRRTTIDILDQLSCHDIELGSFFSVLYVKFSERFPDLNERIKERSLLPFSKAVDMNYLLGILAKSITLAELPYSKSENISIIDEHTKKQACLILENLLTYSSEILNLKNDSTDKTDTVESKLQSLVKERKINELGELCTTYIVLKKIYEASNSLPEHLTGVFKDRKDLFQTIKKYEAALTSENITISVKATIVWLIETCYPICAEIEELKKTLNAPVRIAQDAREEILEAQQRHIIHTIEGAENLCREISKSINSIKNNPLTNDLTEIQDKIKILIHFTYIMEENQEKIYIDKAKNLLLEILQPPKETMILESEVKSITEAANKLLDSFFTEIKAEIKERYALIFIKKLREQHERTDHIPEALIYFNVLQNITRDYLSNEKVKQNLIDNIKKNHDKKIALDTEKKEKKKSKKTRQKEERRAEKEAAAKKAEEEAAKKAEKEAAAKKSKEEVAAKKAKEEAATKKAAREAAKKAQEKAAAKKAKEEAAAEKAREEAAATEKARKEAALKARKQAEKIASTARIQELMNRAKKIDKVENYNEFCQQFEITLTERSLTLSNLSDEIKSEQLSRQIKSAKAVIQSLLVEIAGSPPRKPTREEKNRPVNYSEEKIPSQETSQFREYFSEWNKKIRFYLKQARMLREKMRANHEATAEIEKWIERLEHSSLSIRAFTPDECTIYASFPELLRATDQQNKFKPISTDKGTSIADMLLPSLKLSRNDFDVSTTLTHSNEKNCILSSVLELCVILRKVRNKKFGDLTLIDVEEGRNIHIPHQHSYNIILHFQKPSGEPLILDWTISKKNYLEIMQEPGNAPCVAAMLGLNIPDGTIYCPLDSDNLDINDLIKLQTYQDDQLETLDFRQVRKYLDQNPGKLSFWLRIIVKFVEGNIDLKEEDLVMAAGEIQNNIQQNNMRTTHHGFAAFVFDLSPNRLQAFHKLMYVEQFRFIFKLKNEDKFFVEHVNSQLSRLAATKIPPREIAQNYIIVMIAYHLMNSCAHMYNHDVSKTAKSLACHFLPSSGKIKNNNKIIDQIARTALDIKKSIDKAGSLPNLENSRIIIDQFKLNDFYLTKAPSQELSSFKPRNLGFC